jgi:hypothetical protein
MELRNFKIHSFVLLSYDLNVFCSVKKNDAIMQAYKLIHAEFLFFIFFKMKLFSLLKLI